MIKIKEFFESRKSKSKILHSILDEIAKQKDYYLSLRK